MLENIRYGPRASLTSDLRASIIAQFDIGTITATKDLGGTYNLNVLLETSRGTYVARVYRSWVTYERLNILHSVKQVLHENAFPVAIPIATKIGKTIFPYQDHFAEVENFIPHDNTTETWQRYEIAFSLLAKLHACFATKLEHISIVPPLVTNYGTPDALLTWTLQAEQHIKQTARNENTQLALALCADTLQLLTKMQTWWNGTGHRLPQHMIHGDYGTGNLLFRDEHIVAILDFDFLAIRERIFDLAYTLYWMFCRIESLLPPDKFSWSHVKEMLKNYNSASIQPLTQIEIQALPLEMARVPLYWIAEAHILPDPAQTIISLADNVRFAHWVMEHSDELALLFLKAVE